MNILISDNPKDYNGFMAKVLEALEDSPPSGLAVVAIAKSGEIMTGYWNMSLKDKLTAESHIRFDVLDEFINNNADRYGLEIEGD